MLNCKSKIVSALAFLILLVAASCTKENLNMQNASKDAQLMFLISEQTGSATNKTSNLRASSFGATTTYKHEENEQHQFTEDGAFRITTSLSTAPMSALIDPKSVVSNKLSSRMSGTQTSPSSTILKDGIKYRVVLYDRSTTPSKFVSTSLGIAGKKLLIDVEKGKSYDWAVFSYNDENDPGESQDFITPTTGLKDLLHAKGTTEVVPGYSGDEKEVVMPINVLLQHKLANVSVHVSVKEYPAKIMSLSASLGRNTYFCKNTLNIKTGEFVNDNTQISIDPAMTFVSTEEESVSVANYYTSKFKPITGFSVTLNSLNIRTGTNEIRSLSSPSIHNWEMNPEQGQQNVARIKIEPVRDISGDKFRVLSVGLPHYTLAPTAAPGAHNYSGAWYAMNSEKNFGPNGTYPTTNFAWNIQNRPSPLNAFNDLQNYKIVFVGYGGAPSTAADANKLLAYIEAGGTVIYATGTHHLGAVEPIVWRQYAGGQATTTLYSAVTASPFGQHPILNGTFGDARGAFLGNYPASGYGISNLGNDAEVLALSTANSNVAVAWKAKYREFYFISSEGMQKYYPTHTPGANPFLLTAAPDYIPRSGSWTGRENIANSIMLMNIIAKTIDKVLGTAK
ncbi:hypothetical protein [Sphingobacterium deserti]|uniref:Uncharacterized protein n=1 Tax=Sphingobacterium deserti TaxID=1229276 RepID=A0A0B8T6L4_9SPHI|nr:hypothetical protein [Sphingobacterium deserti]KGE12955.1 hypothetical protein DI53_3172 [Sphingobacterium deserti]